MRIDEFEFRNKQGEEIEPTKDQLVIYIKSLHKQISDLEAKLAEKEKKIESLITDLQKALVLIKEGREIVNLNNEIIEELKEKK